MPFQALRGTSDLLGDDLTRWLAVEHRIRGLADLYGYHEIRTPIIEDAALFTRSVGETTDIVQKEMFQFTDRGGHAIVLRPEGTAAVVRAYLEHNLHKTQGFAKLFYLGPMFRAERPQAGRFRQFHQYGVEAIGSSAPWVDVEVIVLCLDILRACGLRGPRLWLASMGCRNDQQQAAAALRKQLAASRTHLCTDCQERYTKNIFRVLDCKNASCHKIVTTLKESPFTLCQDCAAHFDAVRQGLEAAGIPFDDTQRFARGIDYYTRTVFEVRVDGLGAQDAVAAGGRYDELVEELGGPSLGAVGFAAGTERLLLAAQKHAPEPASAVRRGIYLAIANPELIGEGFRFAQQLRGEGIPTLLNYEGRSLKSQLREADKASVRLVAILGEQELKQRALTIKDLDGGQQDTVPFERFAQAIAARLKDGT